MPESSSAPIIRIGMQLLSEDPFWVLVREGIYQRAERLPIELVPVEVDLGQLPGDKQSDWPSRSGWSRGPASESGSMR